MEPSKIGKTEQNRQKVTIGVIALSMASLLAGASVAATLEEYAAPVYAETDPFEGAVDDLTGEDTWQEKEMDAKPMGKHIRKAMKSRMSDRMEDRTEHLEKRIEIDSNLIIAFQYCFDSYGCSADNETLLGMIDKLTLAVNGMQAKVEDNHSMDYKDDTDKSEALHSSQEACEEVGGTWNTDDQKGDYCTFSEGFKDWEERKDWDKTEMVEFAEEKQTQLRAALTAISFCIDYSDCSADSEIIGEALERMISRADHHKDCADDGRCDRDRDKRKGLRGRIGGAICKMMDSCEKRGEALPEPYSTEITQEMCESRMGVWTEATDRGDSVFYCDWSEAEEPERDDDSEEDDRADDQETSQNQE